MDNILYPIFINLLYLQPVAISLRIVLEVFSLKLKFWLNIFIFHVSLFRRVLNAFKKWNFPQNFPQTAIYMTIASHDLSIYTVYKFSTNRLYSSFFSLFL